MSDISQIDTTPLIDLSSVVVRFRQSGHETMHLKAARLAVFRDLRSITVDDISDGVAYQGDKPALLFSAGEVQFQANYSSLSSGLLRLSRNVKARFVSTSKPIDISTNALSWNWPAGLIHADTTLTTKVGGLGVITCSNIQVDPVTRSVMFGGVTAAAVASVLPVQLGSNPAVETDPPAVSTPARKSTARPDDFVHFYGPEGGHLDAQQNIMTLRGPVTIWRGEASMRTVGAVYDRSTDTAKGLSPVKITDEQNTLTGTQGAINFRTHVATLDGNVELHANPATAAKGSLEAQAQAPSRLICDHMTYDYRTKLADANGHLTILQTNRTVTANTGHFDANTQIATLNGNVDAKDTDGKHLRSSKALVSFKHGDEWIEVPGPITAEFTVNDDTTTPSKTTLPPAPKKAP